MGLELWSFEFWFVVFLIVLGVYFIIVDTIHRRKISKQERTPEQLDSDWGFIERITGKKDMNGR